MAFLRRLLAIEAAAFAAAALVHVGARATTAESIIGLILAVGAVVTWSRPDWTRRVALAAQGLALAGSLIGLYLAVRGIGPDSLPDFVFLAGIVAALVYGMVRAVRAP